MPEAFGGELVSLSPGSDNPPDSERQRSAAFTEEDVQSVADDLYGWVHGYQLAPLTREQCIELASCALVTLAEAGRLLPAGTPQITEEWGVRLVDTRLGTRSSVFVSREMAWANVEYHRRIYATRQTYAGRADLLRREVRSWPDGSQWTGPWEVVQ